MKSTSSGHFYYIYHQHLYPLLFLWSIAISSFLRNAELRKRKFWNFQTNTLKTFPLFRFRHFSIIVPIVFKKNVNKSIERLRKFQTKCCVNVKVVCGAFLFNHCSNYSIPLFIIQIRFFTFSDQILRPEVLVEPFWSWPSFGFGGTIFSLNWPKSGKGQGESIDSLNVNIFIMDWRVLLLWIYKAY